MKKRTAVFKAGTLVLVALPVLCAVAWAVEELIVVERDAAIRKDKRNYSPRLATVAEGEKVALVEKDEPWIRVQYKGVEGWMNESCVTDNPDVVLSGQAVKSGVRATEQSAAKRGFTPEVEKEYRKDHPGLDGAFKLLDEIQKKKFPEESVVKFLEVGKLAGLGEGGAK